jgi:hypothetical protein
VLHPLGQFNADDLPGDAGTQDIWRIWSITVTDNLFVSKLGNGSQKARPCGAFVSAKQGFILFRA